MKLKSQVCSLELAKRLKELGVKQESYFVWHTNAWTHETGLELYKLTAENPMVGSSDWYSAFTVAELDNLILGYTALQLK